MAEVVGFDAFMEDALYGEGGFYATGRGAGRRGADFITSPEVGPLFGAVLANALDQWWDDLGQPDPYVVVEAGAGRGALRDAILTAAPRWVDTLHYVTVEPSVVTSGPQAATRDQRRLAMRTDLPVNGELGEVGVVIANELLDNLPFKIVERSADGWREVLVDDAVFVLGRAVAGFEHIDAPISTRLPWHTHAAAWLDRARALFARSHIALIDYGTRATQELVGREWLRTYREHGRGGDPLDDPGSQDITCDVAFEQLQPDRITTQSDWLRAHGIDALVDQARATWTELAAIGDLEALKARSRVSEADALLDPAGLGAFLVAEWE